ncbi:TPA: valine--tRNA ligase [Candidatus Nomurabacteria bacterium]|nr:valine--tRNA ligase [Candidatus Nomurabacteria bacterium]
MGIYLYSKICYILLMNESNIDPKLLKPYDPKETEDRIYKMWEESGFFNPDVCIEKGMTDKDAETFSMVLPPPNVTGTLHLGHAATLTIEDIMTRFARMKGYKTLWLPGTDHAAIATQSKVEKILEKEEGKRKGDLGREEFLKRVNQFAQESHDTIINQSKKMGASLDWSREAFTLDEKRNLAVRTAFKKMYDDGLIYRGHRIVNWDPKGQTVISDDEIVYEERKAKLYTFKYSNDFPIYISTTRPETKVGDTAVAVHPNDERYKKYIGKTYEIKDFCGVSLNIKIVADESVEKEFGTGALGVTPAHSQIDADIATRHKLDTKQVINEFAKMTVGDERILNKKTIEAREVIVNFLRENNLLEKEEEVTQNISTAERTGGIIEPLPKLQWFIDVNKPIKERDNKSLKELMLEAVRSKEVNIIPNRFEKVYYNWIENLRDWCISRQIWYGHRIPVWYKGEEIYCGVETPNGNGWEQDSDTLDTWFSSGLWTFSTLGWPDLNASDFKTYHPTNMLETGYDILFFWIARMILMSTYLLGEVPFKNVYLHGIVRDAQGRKMSKSLGNSLDPLELTAKYGADAVRMSLIIGTGPGNDSKMSEDKIRAYKNYANKLWNITRFVLSNTENIKNENFNNYVDVDKKLIDEIDKLIIEITKEMDEYKFYLVGEKIYQYTWARFADIILEESKNIFENGAEKEILSRKHFLLYTLEKILKILHPFMPFVTEELWGMFLKENKKLLMIEKWPVSPDTSQGEPV